MYIFLEFEVSCVHNDGVDRVIKLARRVFKQKHSASSQAFIGLNVTI